MNLQLKRQLSEGQKKIEKYIYSMNHLLGKGSFASVYLGRLITDDTPIAVKVIDKRIFTNQYNLKNIHSEIQIMKKMEHNNIVKLLDVYQTNNNMYIITQFCAEGDFRTYLKKKKKLTQKEAVEFLRDILRGFQYMYNKDVIHRDLKPANILITNGTLKISDFGFARNLQDGEETILQSIVGTPLYMSPQILNRQRYTNKSDLWSVGLIYYEMLNGFTPWYATNELQLIKGINTTPVTFDPTISELSKDFIRKCLRRREEDRMSWQQAINHPLIKADLNQFAFKLQDKENRIPRQTLMDLKERQKMRSRSRSISANNKVAVNNLSRTPRRTSNFNITMELAVDKKSPWKM